MIGRETKKGAENEVSPKGEAATDIGAKFS